MSTTKKPAGQTSPRVNVLEWEASPLVMGGIALAGAVLIAVVHGFRATPSVLFLMLGWISLIAAAGFLWHVGLLVAAGPEADDGTFDRETSRPDELNAEKASMLKAIKEVEFDRLMGKLSQEDADAITDVYRRRAIFILKELDSIGDTASGPLTLEQKIERDLKARAVLSAAEKKTEARALAGSPAAALGGKLRQAAAEEPVVEVEKAKDAAAPESAAAAEEEE